MGVEGLSLRVLTLEICLTRSMFSQTFPKTGWADGVDLSNQSRKLLWATLRKNWEPPDLGRPVNFDNEKKISQLAYYTTISCFKPFPKKCIAFFLSE